ncbi:very large low complexity [Cordyceps militaris]|uniref:ubiquitinyl hydrolase 1 n=1 Tax=Cordyceps militaris TaxID=73501 RepID=A0A2H4SEX7_CORMI|nr:very large low complexity [Cordyceps militaris]
MAAERKSLLEAVFDHLVLPSKLPAAPEDDPALLNWEVATRLITACKQLQSTDLTGHWKTLETCLLLTRKHHRPASVETLVATLSTIAQGDGANWLALHIAQQNAAIIIHKNVETDEVVFEAFEVSASAPAVLEAKYALLWPFPCRAVAIPMTEFAKPLLQETIARFMEQATEITFDQFAARALKGNKLVVETRDTPSPALVTEMLMSFLQAMGREFPVTTVQKRVRDDVVLGSSEQPWRRSPYWLLLRVFAQRFMVDVFDAHPCASRIRYKLLMCIVLAHLLAECQTSLHPERVLLLQAKLCRRLAKLQTEIANAPAEVRQSYGKQFFEQKRFFEWTVTTAKHVVEALWEEHKRKTVRPIPLLPRSADQSDLVLQLANSGPKLRELLSANIALPQRTSVLSVPSQAEGTVEQVNKVATQHSKLVKAAQKAKSELHKACLTPEDSCLRMAQAITTYMGAVGSQYADDAILTSQYLLNLFELWVFMDLGAIGICPALKEYHPVFVPEALDMLCFIDKSDIARLRKVQQHIAERIALCSDPTQTIFTDPMNKAAFATTYMREYGEQYGLESLRERIEAASVKSVEVKRRELTQIMSKHQQLTAEMQSFHCVCKRQRDGSLDVRGCTRCYKARTRARLDIKVHEEFLPRKNTHKAAVLLELDIPEFLAAYRDATWRLAMLGWENQTRQRDAVIVLADFEPLKLWQNKTKSSTSITLASQSKAYLQTHYRKLKMPTKEVEVLLPFGPTFAYYDAENGIWANDCRDPPWYHYLLGPWLPKGISDPFGQPLLYRDGHDHPSSYEVAANQNKCPPGMSYHEFEALQGAISGSYRRWMVLLLELGSTNLNLSTASTVKCFRRLALQSGPRHATGKRDVLGKVHSAFHDSGFCESLEHQIRLRLSALQSGRRDLNGMSILTTFTLRLLHFGPESNKPNATALLDEMRTLLSQWISQLRQEVRSTGDGGTARRAAASAVCASLLCRHTFMGTSFNETPLGKKDAAHFFRASIALSENLIVDLDAVSPDLQQLLAQYMSWASSTSDKIQEMAFQNTSVLEKIINETWPHFGGSEPRSFSSWKFCHGGEWLECRTIATKIVSSQTIHYHPLQGHLLIDGKALGRLPLAIQKDAGILELFQGRHLLTRASGVAGMEYQIISNAHKHEVHVGISQGEVIIRARFGVHLLQYVPRQLFRSHSTLDLPLRLVDDCVHWLNLLTSDLEIRRKPDIWASKFSNWVLNVPTKTATRKGVRLTMNGVERGKKWTNLVEPQSRVGGLIANIFRHFEDPTNLVMYQSGTGRLWVEIKRLEMHFFVNHGLLRSNQLKAEVDPVQDIGALYGLESKLVLRSITNPRHKSVIVPIGSCCWERRGPHVSVRISNSGQYALFTVDPLLGRLSCAPEPALFYLKALIHALTSFPLPDKLTGRTGTEEACRCLTAAQSQPWKPLNLIPRDTLSTIMKLSPKREYYPPHLKLYQHVTWDQNLTATVQHEQLAIHAGDILRQSRALATFDSSTKNQEASKNLLPDMSSLSLRGILRRQIYERIEHPSDIELLSQVSQNELYRQRGADSEENVRVYRSVKQLRNESSKLTLAQSLYPMLKKWQSFDGFNDSLDTLNTLDIARILNAEASEMFGPLIGRLRSSSDVAQDHIAQLSVALFVFGTDRSANAVEWLAAIGSNSLLREIQPPDIERFSSIGVDQGFNKSAIRKLVVSCQDNYAVYLSADKVARKARSAVAATADAYDYKIKQEAESIASWLSSVWPNVPLIDQFHLRCNELGLEVLGENTWTFLEPELQRLSQNHALSKYVNSLEAAVESLREDGDGEDDNGHILIESESACLVVVPSSPLVHAISAFRAPSISEILCTIKEPIGTRSLEVSHRGKVPSPEVACQTREESILKRLPSISRELSTLLRLVQPFKSSRNMIQQQYGQDLEKSIVAMAVSLEKPRPKAAPLNSEQDDVAAQIVSVQQDLYSQLHDIIQLLTRQHACHFWLDAGQLWPCSSLTAMLEQLRLKSYRTFPQPLQQSLVHLGISVTKLQHLLRIEDAQSACDDKRLRGELEVEGHSNWSPTDFPEWLLLEIDNNILIRPLQVDVAKAIVSPQSGQNSVLQMNMGTGKTSIVMPMAAIILADTTRLCRVIVPKALLLQTAQVLQSRIGGLIGRQVRHIPFSRHSASDAATLSTYKSIHEEILQMGGLMLCIPAHVLSFKLSGLQRLADHRLEEGKKMVEIQKWLDSTCRDILDESDMTLSVHTQLIYPSGDLTTLDGHPYRWLVVEHLLSLVESHSSNLQKSFEGKVVVVKRRQGFPILHFITTEPEDALNELLVDDICDGRLPQLQIRESGSKDTKNLIRKIITGANVSSSEWETALASLKDDTFGPKTLYLVRGLISQRILVVCLKKKWNIQYGLHPDRQPIAVPFEAKGIPSQAAEYGHPDTTLLLTCLAFYQQGLSKEQLKQGLQGVMQSDDAAAHYDRWVCSCTALPSSLRSWSMLDPENEVQMETLWAYLRFDRTVVNHHLNTYIFPRFAKQFPVKLVASGWDIPLLHSGGGSQPRCLTTGFSGTNDNKHILPQTIEQNDLPELLNTNAQVLCHLLDRRNADCHLTAEAGVRFDEKATLMFLCKNDIRVLIDAGAHILEMGNHEVARNWLNIDTQAQGAIYFGANSQIMVCSRFQKEPMPLIASPFANDMEECVVYIDEGHTRGTDLKLPADAKGAVTLSLGQTKDQTVQAAMRLRQLGTTQSVAFLAPPEVYRAILDLRTQEEVGPYDLTSQDVVRWLLDQSCKANQQMMGLHLSQCWDFCRRTDMLWKHPDYATSGNDLKKVLGVIRQEEQQTLQHMYGPGGPPVPTDRLRLTSRRLLTFTQNVERMARHGQSSCSSALMEVEQEREVVLEVEHMREKETQRRHVALTFPGPDRGLLDFVKTGCLDTRATRSQAPLMQAFEYIGKTKIGRLFRIQATKSCLYVSREFVRTIAANKMMEKEDIVRPVHWILWNPSTETGLIIIPEEADVVIPLLRKMAKPLVWLLGYTAPVTKSMQSFHCLSYLTVPRWPSIRQIPAWLGIEVGIFSGRLYFDFAEYEALLAWLGLLPDQEMAACFGRRQSEQPLQFLQEWLAFRRQTEDILYTPVGFVCQRRMLHESHFFFSRSAGASLAEGTMGTMGREEMFGHDDDDDDDEEDDMQVD